MASGMSSADFDVGLHAHLVFVERLRGQVGQERELLFHQDDFFGVLAEFGQLVGVGIDDDHAAPTVDDDDVPTGHLAGEIPHAHYRGNAHRAGNDRGVAGAPADIGGKPLHMRAVQGGGLRRQQIVGDHHHVAGEMGQVFVLLPDQIFQDSAFDVVNIFDTLLKNTGRSSRRTDWHICG